MQKNQSDIIVNNHNYHLLKLMIFNKENRKFYLIKLNHLNVKCVKVKLVLSKSNGNKIKKYKIGSLVSLLLKLPINL